MPFTAVVIKAGDLVLERYAPVRERRDKKILFVHSAGHGSWLWKNFLSYFADRGFDAWAVNLRGHYLSAPVEDWAAVGLNEYLDDLEEAAKKIGSKLVLLGHSMTGLLVLKYAETHQPAGVIVSHTGPPKSMLDKRGIEIKRRMPPGAQKKITDKTILPMTDREMVQEVLFDKGNVDKGSVDLVLEKMGEESLRAGHEIMQMALDPDNISSAVYVLGFDPSKLGIEAPLDISKVLAEELNARDYKIIEPGGHNYMLERNWQDFALQFETWIMTM